MGLQKLEGKGIGIKVIGELSSQELSLPMNNSEAMAYLKIYNHAILLISWSKRYIYKKLNKLNKHLLLEEYMLDNFQIQDSKFYLNLIFYIYNKVQHFIQSFLHNEKTESPSIRELDFHTLMEIIWGRHFCVELPALLYISLAK